MAMVFPAASAACNWIELVPCAKGCVQVNVEPESVAREPPQLTDTTPEMSSVTVPFTITVVVPRIAPSSGEVIVSAGGVLSRLTRVTCETELSARSVAVAAIDWSFPSWLKSTGSGQTATPDRASAHWQVRVISELIHPSA